MSNVVSPTQEQFQKTAREAFDFLPRDYGFREIPAEYDDPFGVQYQNKHCRVQVTVKSFGFRFLKSAARASLCFDVR